MNVINQHPKQSVFQRSMRKIKSVQGYREHYVINDLKIYSLIGSMRYPSIQQRCLNDSMFGNIVENYNDYMNPTDKSKIRKIYLNEGA